MHKGKKSNKIPDNMENAYNVGQDVLDNANKIDMGAPTKKSKKTFNIGYGW